VNGESEEPTSAGRRRERREATPPRLQARRAAGFLVALVLTIVLAFNGGGYDLVIRHQVGLAVWALIALGLGVGILPRSRLTPASCLALGGFAALAVWTLLSHAWTESDERTTEELARVLQYLGLILLAYLALNRRSWQGAAAGFAVAALAVPCFAVCARLFPALITDHLTSRYGIDRLSYPLDYWNGVACWGAMATAIGLSWSANAPRAIVRGLALAAVPVAALSVYLTYSRFGAAAMAIAVVAAVALSRNRWTATANAFVALSGSAVVILTARSHDEIARATGGGGGGTVLLVLVAVGLACGVAAFLTSRAGLDGVRMDRLSAGLSLAGAVVALLLAAVALHGPLDRAWHEFRTDKTPVTASAANPSARYGSFGGARYSVWKRAVDAFKSDPLRGIGAGSFEFYWSRHGTETFVVDAHSIYLEQAAELGVPGVVALLAGLGGLLAAAIAGRRHWRRRRDLAAGPAMIAAFVVFLAYAGVDWMWELGAVGALAIGGVATAGAGSLERASKPALGRWTRAALTSLAVLVGAVQIPGLVSTERIRASQDALVKGDLDGAMKLANQAIEAEDWAASPYAARAEVAEASGDLAGAKRDVQQAIDRDRFDWREHLLLARIDAERGDRKGVAAELREIRRLAPHSPYLNPLSPYRQELDRLLSRRG
jgi:O-antigen ligase/polysaccharide polymerase Wzy-like membrane protein